MPYTEEKVRFNLKNVHYALATVGADGTHTYDTPVPWPGARTLTMNASGDEEVFYADGVRYWVVGSNEAYDGDLEMARLIDAFKKDVLGYEEDGKGVLFEPETQPDVVFALLFEFDGDQRSRRHILYDVHAGRPGISGQTTEGSKTPQTETVPLTASPALVAGKHIIKAESTHETDATVYNNWYTTVHVPTAASVAESTEE